MPNYPNYPHKHKEETLVSAQQVLQYRKQIGKHPSIAPPDSVILCYQRRLWDYICSLHEQSPNANSVSDAMSHMRILTGTGPIVAATGGFGVGAPVVCIVLEQLIAFGVKRFISIGTAGSLQRDLSIGDLVICQKAIRDEGTSHHYQPPSKYAHASHDMVSRITTAFQARDIPYRLGVSWTIDAPYRETIAEVKHYQQEGVATVEMEASALFAVAAHHSVEMGAIFTISDSLADMKWEMAFHSAETEAGLKTLYEIALASLT